MLDASTKQTRPETAADEPRARCDASRCHVLELCSSDHLTAAACLMQELHREMAGRYAGDPRFVECFLDRRHCERELSRLPGAYAPPGGAILLAVCGDEELVGCVALRHAGDDACELQRLYVRPAWRGRGFGKALVASALAGARARGYRIVRAAPMDAQWEARLLLRALDFEEDDSTTGHARKADRRWQLMELDFERILDQAQTREEAPRAPGARPHRPARNTEPPPGGVAQRR